jgi:hypothetical protein
MRIKIEALQPTFGEKGINLEVGKVYEFKPKTATELIRLNRAKIAETGLVRVKILYDNVLKGLRYGMVEEIPAAGANLLIKEGKAEIYYDEENEVSDLEVEILITESTFADVDGKKGTPVFAGKTYRLKPSEAAILISMKKAKFPNSKAKVKLKFNKETISGGSFYKIHDVAKLPALEAEELLQKFDIGVAEPIEVEEAQEAQETQESKTNFIGRFLGGDK